jgi:teichoic acid transport system ATP-binding protein
VSNKITVVTRKLGKSYYISKNGNSIGLSRQRMTEVEALQSVSFVSHAGESIGILGKNGSGKSTLIRLIAGSESPSHGEVFVSNKPTMLGVSAALQPQLTGRQNVKLGLLAMGLKPAQVEELSPEVIEWAELTDSIDRPMKTYSSGMSARLKFSIATAVKAEILLVDEALSTGDTTFKSKATERMNEFLDTAGTVFLVSHGAETIQKHCSRAIWLHEGEMIADGPAEQITKSYRVWGNRAATGKPQEAEQIIQNMRERFQEPQIVFDDEASLLLENT